MRRDRIMPGYRWRMLSDEQADAIRAARASGVAVVTLAREYGVDKRTIYRALKRSAAETHVDVRTGDWHARFGLTEDGPVQTTAWYPAADSLDVSA